MKILHTSDWHLGRNLHGFSLVEDQAYILDEMLEEIKREKVELLIIAGDIYDKSIPNEEAVKLFNGFLCKVILELKIAVIAIAGNHDSNARIHFGSELFESQKLFIVGKAEKGYKRLTITQKGEEVDIYVIPYIEPAQVRELAEDETIKRHDESMTFLIEEIQKEKREVPTLLVAHAFVTGGDISDSERRLSVVGGAELVDASRFKDFTYTALGHLHKQQAMGQKHIRYSGSLLKYSISEANQKKGYVLLDLKPDGELTIEEKALKPLRDVRILSGTLDEIIARASEDSHKEDYVFARVTGPHVQDVTAVLRHIYPHILGSEWQVASEKVGQVEKGEEAVDFLETRERTVTELFMEFLEHVGEVSFEEEDKHYIEEIVREIEEGKYET